ncbi:MAG: hypothetical protein IH624_12760 [Phycisphaerae bacterium]|nr:hypothetical protein [Phycisphaerae bacterium]
MGRPKRIALGGYVYHVLNRANGRLRIFKKGGDFEAFEQILSASPGTVGIGHQYQGRYKSFPVQDNAYYLTVMRYVEGNPVRAGIVEQAGDRRWSSFAVREGRASKVGLAEGPLALPGDWEGLVDRQVDAGAAEQIGRSMKRGCPLGDGDWIAKTAKELNLESTLRGKGRPKKVPDTFS